MSPGIRMGPSSGIPHITLGQEHITINRLTTVAFQPSDGVGHTILALPEAQVPHALGHALNVTRPTNPIRPTRARKRSQHSISSAQPIRVVPNRGPTFLQHNRLILLPEESGVVVLDIATLKLNRTTTRLCAQPAELAHRSCHARGAVGHSEVPAALEEAVNDVVRAGACDVEVVVGRVGGRVDQGGHEPVYVGLIGRVWRVFLLSAATEDETIGGRRGGERRR